MKPLSSAELYRSADLSSHEFGTTAELTPAEGMIGQDRARDAIALATQMRSPGFNIYVSGLPASGMRDAVKAALGEAATARPSPSDWVYVHNFTEATKPVAIELPPGKLLPGGRGIFVLQNL